MKLVLCLALAVGIGGSPARAEEAADPDATRAALVALLAVAAEPIAPHSSCAGDYLTGPKPTIGDLLAMQLAYLYKGDNLVAGACEGGPEAQCSLSMRHDAGESRSSATIRFRARDGRAMPETLECTITP